MANVRRVSLERRRKRGVGRQSVGREPVVADQNDGKIMLGFLVRRCAHAIGHDPSPAEFAAWANTFREEPGDRPKFLFGRPISVAEAEVIMRNPGRAVRTRLGPLSSPADTESCATAATTERRNGRVVVLGRGKRVGNASQK